MSIVGHDLCAWENIVQNKWIILDTNTIINLIKYKDTEKFLEITDKLKVNLITLQPVVLELNRTNEKGERIKRNQFLNSIDVLPIDESIRSNAGFIQKDMWLEDYYPEPTDLYLASTIKKFSNGKTLLATSNLDDFREPLFKKEGFLILSSKKSICPISLLSFQEEA